MKEWGWKILSWICCLLCTGPILTIIGVIFLVSAVKDERGDNVKKFNEGVAQFNAIRADWDARSFTADQMTPSALSTIETKEFAVEDSKLAAWTPLYYRVSAVPSTFPASASTTPVAVDFTEAGSGTMATSSVAPNKMRTLSGSSTTTSTTSSPPSPPPPPSPPRDQYYRLTKICRAIAEGAGNGYKSGSGGVGCFSSLTGSTTNEYGAGLTYTSCGTVNQGQAAPAACSGGQVEATLRHEKDPIVLGFANGACGRNPSTERCSFGLSRTSKIVLGLIFLIIGISWTCCVYGGLYAVILYFQRRNK